MRKVTVIIPTYNRAGTIEKAIKSVLDQTFEDFTLIVVDDCSSDDTEKVVANIPDERIVYHRLSENKGAAGARNEGARLATTEFIAFQDSDDAWLPDKLEKQMKYMEDHPEAGMVYGRMRVISPEKTYEFPNEAVTGDLEGKIYPWLLRRNTVGTPVMFIKKKYFEETGGFDTSLRCLEDWEFAIRFSKRFEIGYIDDVLMDSFLSEGGVSRNIGAYYETRCKMLSLYKNDIIDLGVFDEIVTDIFTRAEKTGILPQVQKMLMASLAP
ncbi:MAG: glycosyltransferase [Lachnospiraceae bacterium]|nr:glycosyltransferase [Lachnospiraceae bacterium]